MVLAVALAAVITAFTIARQNANNTDDPVATKSYATGEFFANEKILEPFERFVTGLFGEPRDQILPMMPQSDPDSIKRMFMFFGFSFYCCFFF